MTGTTSEGRRSGTYTTSDGRTGNFSGEVLRNADGTRTRNLSITNREGETYDRSATYDYDRETGTLERTVTGPGASSRTGYVTFIPVQR